MKKDTQEYKSAVIVEHEANEVGPGHALERYFLGHGIHNLLYIGHPNLYIKKGFEKCSRTVTHRFDGKTTYRTARFWKMPEWCLYIKDCLYTLFWVARDKRQHDLYVGLGNINALCGVVLKRLGIVKIVIYYVIDYMPNRFRNPIMNTVYVYAERFAASWSDYTWNLSSRMIDARNHRWNTRFSHQLVVPHGLYLDEENMLSYSRINKYELIYMGNLNQEQGIQLVIGAMAELKKIIPHIEFTIIGKGNYETELKQLTAKLRLNRHIHFLGLIPDDRIMEKRLGHAAVAVAMYKPEHNFVSYADPGKIKYYLSAGLPIVMTDKPQIAHEIDRYCGYVIPYDKQIFIKRVAHLLGDRQLLVQLKNNSVRLARRYDWNNIFGQALVHSV